MRRATEDGERADDGMPEGVPVLSVRLFEPEAAPELEALGIDWVWETDAAFRFTRLSDRCERLTGLKRAAILGRASLIPDESGTAGDREFDSALAGRKPFRDVLREVPSVRPGCRWVALSGAPLIDVQGALTGYRGSARNVTAIVAAARSGMEQVDARGADAAAERLMNALNLVDDAVTFYDADDRIVLYNDALTRMYRGLDDVIRPGLHIGELVDEANRRGLWDIGGHDPVAWRDAFLARRGSGESVALTLRFNDGRWVMHREVRTADGGRMGICTDITALKDREARAEQAREQAEAARRRLQAAIDALDDGFVLWDGEDRLVACNDSFRRQFALMVDLEPGRSFVELFREFAHTGIVADAVGREEEWVAEHAASRDGELGREILFDTHDGRWMMRRDRMTRNGDRVGIRTDVTELKRREAEVEAANERARSLLADFERTIDTMHMGVVLLDADLRAEIVNRAFYDIWRITREDVGVGRHFRALMDVNRGNGIYAVADAEWDAYVAMRLAEIAAGDVAPREFVRGDGSTLIYSVTALSGGKRLVCYYDITALKQREAELAQALDRTRLADAVINGVKDPIFVKDEQLRFVFANKAFAAMFAIAPEAMLGKTASDFAPPDDAAHFEATEREVLATGQSYEVEEDFEFQNIGRSRIVRKNRVSLDGGKDFVAGFVFDVTEIRRREREAEEAHSRLAHVLETLPAGVVIYDRDDRFVLANERIHATMPELASLMKPGTSMRKILLSGREAGYFSTTDDPDLDRLYQRDPEEWLEAYVRRFHVRKKVSERRHRDGRWFQVHDTRMDSGLFVGVRIDITELKEREAVLRETTRENELFRSLIDNVPVAIYAKRPDLRLVYVNKGWSDLTGIAYERAVGNTDVDVFGPEGAPFMQADMEVLETGEMREVEEVATDLAGLPRHQIARKAVMTASDGSLYLIGSTTDISELKRREEELRCAEQRAVLADRAKSEFLANMSHEIRTPMNGVLGMAELLAKTELDAKQRTFTDIIVKSGNALLTIINDILDFSKIDAGQLVLDPAPFRIAESVEDVATLMSTRAKEKDIELIVRVAPDLPRLLIGDAGRLRQIVTNLVGNAVKFTDAGHVLVDVRGRTMQGGTPGGEVELVVTVEDTGIGIPPDKLASVFEKFSQVDSSSTRRHEGTGLGLAITQRLVALMGGDIGVDSQVGKGSKFWFRVRLPAAEQTGTVRVAPIDVTGARVLVVDDNPVNRSILIEQMRSWAFDACAACSGAEALAVVDAAAGLGVAIDCIVLDYQMPDMNGAAVAKAVRSRAHGGGIPIVMLTSVDQSLTAAQHRDLGIGANLIKPARSSALLEAVVGEIQKRRKPAVAAGQPVVGIPSPPRPVPLARPAGPASARRLDILVAEDNEVNQLVFAQILGETPHTFEIVRNGRLAVEACREMRPGLVLMDVSMPEMNGIEATRAIREAEAVTGERVAVVGVTAHALKGDRERCLEAGMDDYLPKPISPNALLAKIDAWLGGGGARRRAVP